MSDVAPPIGTSLPSRRNSTGTRSLTRGCSLRSRRWPRELFASFVFMTNGHDLGHLRSAASERKLQREKEHTVDTLANPSGANTTAASKPAIPTPALLLEMLHVSTRVSDLIFSPGSLPHVEVSG